MSHPLLDRKYSRFFLTYCGLVSDFDPNKAPPETVNVDMLRYARLSDIARCAYLADLVWRGDASRVYGDQVFGMFRSSNRSDGVLYFVTENGPELTGFAGVRKSWMHRDAWELTGIVVHPKWQARGIGRALTDARLELIRALGGKYVLISTIRPDYFERFDFEAIDSTGDGWVTMRHHIDSKRTYFHG
jgi:N-acetylglutamate synthase-like GNAT family acetyltransferase